MDLAPQAFADELLHHVGSRRGVVDLPCPSCGPGRKSVANQRRKTLRVWCGTDDFISWHCVRCNERGWARPETSRTFAGSALPIAPTAPISEQTDEQRLQKALWLWRARRPIHGSIAETYLRKGLLGTASVDARLPPGPR